MDGNDPGPLCCRYKVVVLGDQEKGICKAVEKEFGGRFSVEKKYACHDLKYYEEPLTAVIVSGDKKVPLFTVVQRWCRPRQSVSKNDYEWWLAFDKSLYPDKLVSTDRWQQVCKFSFGNFVGLNTFVEHYTPETSDCVAFFEHDMERIELRFRIKTAVYYIEVDYNSILKMLLVYFLKDKHALIDAYLFLNNPVLLYQVDLSSMDDSSDYEDNRKEQNLVGNSAEEPRLMHLYEIDVHTPWIRVIDFEDCNKQKCTSGIIGMSTVLRLQFKFSDSWGPLTTLMQNCKNANVYFSPMTILDPVKEVNLNFPQEYFACRYALECILSRSRQLKDEVGCLNNKKEIVNHLKELAKKNAKALEKALYEIHAALEAGNVVIFSRALEILFYRYCEYDREELRDEMVYVRKAVLTPTRIVFLPPQQYKTSRLLNKFDSECALKLNVRDDNMEKLCFTLKGTGSSREAFLEGVLKKKLMNGVKIGKTGYSILGSSTNQLKDNGLWFYAVDKNNRSAADIRKELGHFDEIKAVPKYMARIGLFLSQAQNRVNIPRSCTEVEQDVEGGRDPNGKPYVFSDGIGKMSKDVAEKVYKTMKLEDKRPCAIQIRYAGCKGMLVWWSTDVDPKLGPGEKIVFRESMKKVESDDTSLEILKISAPRSMTLNRPFITILDQKAVNKTVIYKLQSEEFKTLSRGLIYEDDASRLLAQYSSTSLPFRELQGIGIQLTAEPFFRSMLHSIMRKTLYYLKTKARISVPFDWGRNALGVLDETGTLKYGEVFFQCSTDMAGAYDSPSKIITGTVMITKNPCMHPGDVRKFKAIDVPGLHHIRDCIVFPRKGKRPHPDEMAGSDLDGDEYIVIWNEDFMFEADNYDAMHYPSDSDAKIEEKGVTEEDMASFFCKYILDDNVGLIANAHLAWADQKSKDQGIHDPMLIELARKYSISLDAAKRGYTAKLEPHERPFKYPDFMEKHDRVQTYIADSLLGKLYRHCLLFEMGVAENEVTVEHLPDPTLKYPGWESYKDDAEKALEIYENQIFNLMKTYNIQTEGELISGSFLKTTKYLKEKDEAWDVRELIAIQVNFVFERMRQHFVEEFQTSLNAKDENIVEEIRKKASAWYMVPYQKNSKCFGLPWTIAKEVCSLKIFNDLERPLCYSPLISMLDDKLFHILGDQIAEANRINVALDLLFNWTKHQKELISGCDDSEIDNLKNFLHDNLIALLASVSKDEERLEYVHAAIGDVPSCRASVGQLIIDCLQRLSEMYLNRPPNNKPNAQYELSLLAFVTLSKFACQRDVTLLGIGKDVVSDCTPVTLGSAIHTIKLRISLRGKEFGEWAPRHMDEIKNELKKLVGVELQLEPKQIKGKRKNEKPEGVDAISKDEEKKKLLSKGKQVEKTKEIAWYLLLKARGNMYSLIQLKEFVICETFQQDIQALVESSEVVDTC